MPVRRPTAVVVTLTALGAASFTGSRLLDRQRAWGDPRQAVANVLWIAALLTVLALLATGATLLRARPSPERSHRSRSGRSRDKGMRARIVAVALVGAAAASLTTARFPVAGAAPAADSRLEHITGALHFCAAGPCPPALTWVGRLHALGPFAGNSTVNILSDRPSADFTEDRTFLGLSVVTANGDDSIVISVATRLTVTTQPAPCPFDHSSTCVYFRQDGSWRLAFGTGPYAALRGGGTIHSHGIAVNHAPGKGGYSDVRYNLAGRLATWRRP